MRESKQNKSKLKNIQKPTKSFNQDRNLLTASNFLQSSQNWEQNYFMSHLTIDNSINNHSDMLSRPSHQAIEDIYGKIELDDEIFSQQIFISQDQKSSSQKQIRPEFERVFQINRQSTNKIKQETKRKKNSNVAKHFIKKFIYSFKKRAPSFFANTQEQQQILKDTQKSFNKEIECYKKNRNWNNNLDAMKKIFGENNDATSKKRSLILRKMAQYIIRQDIIPEVLSNPQIKDMAFTYIYTLLIQIYRCKSSQLMERTQIV